MLSTQIAKHLRDVHYGGNWTYSSFKDVINGVDWQMATTQVDSLNTIALLTFHMNYYIERVNRVLQGYTLEASDKLSFLLSEISSEDQWQALIKKTFADVDQCISLIEKLPENIWSEDFTDKKYGSYYRNFHGIIEHCHYHLGQIAIIKKLVQNKKG